VALAAEQALDPPSGWLGVHRSASPVDPW